VTTDTERFATHDIDTCNRDRERTRHSLAEARRLRDEACGDLEARRLAVSEALGLGTSAPWDAITERARDLAAVERSAVASGVPTAGSVLTAHAIRDAARRADEAERAARADVAAARQAEQQAGATLTLRHHQLADALGLSRTTSWPDLIQTVNEGRALDDIRAGDGPWLRAYREDLTAAKDRALTAERASREAKRELDDLREQATADRAARSAAQRAAEQRARDTAATLRQTEDQLAAARKDAAATRIRSGRHFAEARRNRDAWRNARRRAALMTAEVTRRAPLQGEYAERAIKAEATIERMKRTNRMVNRGARDADERAERAEATLTAVRKAVGRLAAHAVGFQDVLDESDREPWGRTIGADLTELQAALGDPQPATEPEPPCFHPAWETEATVGARRCTDCGERLDPQPAAPDGAALWATIRDHAAADTAWWDRIARLRQSRPAGFPVSLRRDRP
jgi:hypothetical protein